MEMDVNGRNRWVVWNEVLKKRNADTKELGVWLKYKRECENDYLNLSIIPG